MSYCHTLYALCMRSGAKCRTVIGLCDCTVTYSGAFQRTGLCRVAVCRAARTRCRSVCSGSRTVFVCRFCVVPARCGTNAGRFGGGSSCSAAHRRRLSARAACCCLIAACLSVVPDSRAFMLCISMCSVADRSAEIALCVSSQAYGCAIDACSACVSVRVCNADRFCIN